MLHYGETDKSLLVGKVYQLGVVGLWVALVGPCFLLSLSVQNLDANENTVLLFDGADTDGQPCDEASFPSMASGRSNYGQPGIPLESGLVVLTGATMDVFLTYGRWQ